MQANKILQADVLDLIFENRNKSYGAYALRKSYDVTVQKALLITFVLASALLLLSFIKKDRAEENSFEYKIPDTDIGSVRPDPPKPPEPPKIKMPVPAVPHKPVETQQHVPFIEIVKDNTFVPPIKDLKDHVAIGSVTTPPTITGSGPVIGDPGPTNPVITTPAAAKPTVDKETPMATAEIMPAYPGGMEKLRDFLARNLHSPESLDEGQTVSVKIRFVVGYDGKLKGFEIVEDGGTAFNREVIRVLKKMPDWIPGKSKGENVSVYYTVPVKFTPEF
ncbi:MAG: energy transducer TonB [Ferruginibacter sp.]